MTIAPHENDVARRVEEYREAYEARDLERMLVLFADDAEYTLAPGTFRGKDEIRRLLAWDTGLSPTASVRDTGIGVLVCGRCAAWERVLSLTAEGIPYEEETATIIELDEQGQIKRVRSYYDKLALLDEIASRYPGIKGWLLRRMTGFLLAQGRKGLD